MYFAELGGVILPRKSKFERREKCENGDHGNLCIFWCLVRIIPFFSNVGIWKRRHTKGVCTRACFCGHVWGHARLLTLFTAPFECRQSLNSRSRSEELGKKSGSCEASAPENVVCRRSQKTEMLCSASFNLPLVPCLPKPHFRVHKWVLAQNKFRISAFVEFPIFFSRKKVG